MQEKKVGHFWQHVVNGTLVPRPNDRCICNSGKKYKKCCGGIVRQSEKLKETLDKLHPVQISKLTGIMNGVIK